MSTKKKTDGQGEEEPGTDSSNAANDRREQVEETRAARRKTQVEASEALDPTYKAKAQKLEAERHKYPDSTAKAPEQEGTGESDTEASRGTEGFR